MFTQVSILYLYKRVFTINNNWFRYTLYILGLLCICVNVSMFLAVLFACTPVNYSWNKMIKGHCFEVRRVYLAHTVLVLVLDIFIVAAPMPIVWGLHTTKATKGVVAGLFLLGGLSVFITE